MAFLNGRVSALRFQVKGPRPGLFSEDHLQRLVNHAAGRQRLEAADGIEVGWTAGEHVLDTDFQLAKNIVADSLNFELRIDSEKLPSDLLRAYYSVELRALAAQNPSGLPSGRQKREAKEAARNRLETEAKDGRYRRRKLIPVLWDALSNELLFGATSLANVERLAILFQHTFGQELSAITSGRHAYRLAELHQRSRNVDDSSPAAFVPGVSPNEFVWIADETSRDFLGNEFLLWLWFTTDVNDDTLTLSDGSDATIMLARSLMLECPRGVTGHETIS
ncbi:MAG: hypothetical protein ACRCZF_11050, partial [Gemmataceae bacterium]